MISWVGFSHCHIFRLSTAACLKPQNNYVHFGRELQCPIQRAVSIENTQSVSTQLRCYKLNVAK